MTDTTAKANEVAAKAESLLDTATATATDTAKSASATVQDAAKSAAAAAQDATKTVTTTAQDAAKTIADTSATLYAQAKDVIGQAVETTISAAKEHPVAAAAIGAGVAATVAGAAYGVSKLLDDSETTDLSGAKPKK